MIDIAGIWRSENQRSAFFLYRSNSQPFLHML
jgi:hypothetical protein